MAAPDQSPITYFTSLESGPAALVDALLTLDNDLSLCSRVVETLPLETLTRLSSSDERESSKETCFLRLDKLWLIELFKLLRLLPEDMDWVICCVLLLANIFLLNDPCQA